MNNLSHANILCYIMVELIKLFNAYYAFYNVRNELDFPCIA